MVCCRFGDANPRRNKEGNPCDLKSFVKKVCQIDTKVPIRGPDGKVIQPVQFSISPDFDSVDWNGIGDGKDFNQDKFAKEMDRVSFHGLMLNSVLFKGWSGGVSFNSAMGEAERIALKAQAQLTKNGQPVSNDRYLALQKALQIHGNARRLDGAIRLLNNFDKWNKQRNYEIHLGDEISRPPVPPYRKLDSEAMITANRLVGKKGRCFKGLGGDGECGRQVPNARRTYHQVD
ncbi:hypothetical protein BKA65DRAFT_559208 [Rhexocercosporidium sp. MPI-PUGE-AT-0058]|nr:hypothetical protein BKA65DRAFT_559208 [Rhexocercosporidium sp. MPI-PUGE-AT-0058]